MYKNFDSEPIGSATIGDAGLQSCSPAQSPYSVLALDRTRTLGSGDLASCDPRPYLPKLELDRSYPLGESDLVSCDPQPLFPKLGLDRSYPLGEGDLISCDPQPHLPVDNGQCPTVILPWATNRKVQPSQPKSKRHPAPDISQGLGQRRGQKDIVALAKYMRTQFKLLTRKDEYGKYALYVFEPPCWRVLSDQDAQRMILAVLQREELPGSGGEKLDDSISGNDARMIYYFREKS